MDAFRRHRRFDAFALALLCGAVLFVWLSAALCELDCASWVDGPSAQAHHASQQRGSAHLGGARAALDGPNLAAHGVGCGAASPFAVPPADGGVRVGHLGGRDWPTPAPVAFRSLIWPPPRHPPRC